MRARLFFSALMFAWWALPVSLEAGELRMGWHHTQVRDAVFEKFSRTPVDRFWDMGAVRFFDTLHVEWAERVTAWGVEAIGALRYGSESAKLDGLATQLTLIEPVVGIRKAGRWSRGLEGYLQAELALVYLQTRWRGSVFESKIARTRSAARPMLSARFGLRYLPPIGSNRRVGLAVDAGYDTWANLHFRNELDRRRGIDPGAIEYGGVQYGVYLVLKP